VCVCPHAYHESQQREDEEWSSEFPQALKAYRTPPFFYLQIFFFDVFFLGHYYLHLHYYYLHIGHYFYQL